MKRILLVCLFGISALLSAQETRKDTLKNYVLFSTGSTAPIGDFADDNPKNKKAGLAEPGISYHFEWSFIGTDNVKFILAYTSNRWNYPYGYVPGGTSNADYTIQSTGYYLGPVFQFDKKYFAVDFKVLLGCAYNSIERDRNREMAIQLGTNLRIHLYKYIDVVATLHYSGTKSVLDQHYKENPIPITSINSTFGIALKI